MTARRAPETLARGKELHTHTRHIPCGSVCMDHAEYTHLWGERVGQCSCGSEEGAGTGAVTPMDTGWGAR